MRCGPCGQDLFNPSLFSLLHPRCPRSHVSSTCPFSSLRPDTLLSSLRLLPRPPIRPPVVSQEVLRDSYRIISRSRVFFFFFFFYVALNSEGDEIERWLMWRENELICILQRRHSNCHPTLLFLVVFCYSLSRSHISRAMRLTCAAGQDCGLTFSFSGPISRPPCHSPLLSLLRTLHLTLLPPNLCRQY